MVGKFQKFLAKALRNDVDESMVWHSLKREQNILDLIYPSKIHFVTASNFQQIIDVWLYVHIEKRILYFYRIL